MNEKLRQLKEWVNEETDKNSLIDFLSEKMIAKIILENTAGTMNVLIVEYENSEIPLSDVEKEFINMMKEMLMRIEYSLEYI